MPGQADEAPLAEHVAESIDAIAEFHHEHYRTASGLQREMDRLTDVLGRPAVLTAVFVAIGFWVVATFVVTDGGVEQPSFFWLELVASVSALLVALLILVTQRRQDRLADRRDQFALQLALLSDRKNAKIISLLEELRRDHPDVDDRADAESEEMAKPADPEAVLAALDDRLVQPRAAPSDQS
jgi:uncharacterized membrane protein